MIHWSEDVEYAYAVGRVRALESKLVTKQTLDRMVDASDEVEAMKLLFDTPYGVYLSEIHSPSDFEKILKFEQAKILDLFEELCLDERIVKLFRLKYDVHNVKVLLKCYISKQDFTHLFSAFGNFDAEKLKTLLEEERYDRFPPEFQSTVTKIIEDYYHRSDPRIVDLVMDAEMFTLYLKRSKEIDIEFLYRLFQTIIDLTNLRTFFRVKWLKEEKEILRSGLLYGGTSSPDYLIDLIDEPWEILSRKFFATPYFELVEHGSAYLHSEDSFVRLEKLCDDYLIDFLRQTKLLTFGVEPVVAYLLAKENELKTLRMVFVGKLNKIEPKDMKERLPENF